MSRKPMKRPASAGEAEFEGGLAEFGLLAKPVAPPAGLRTKLLARAREAAPKNPAAPNPTIVFRSSGDGAWQETGVPGVSLRRLFDDTERRLSTFLVRMEPGSTFPAHDHPCVEECYVIEGDVRLGRRVLRAGDYQRAESGSWHGEHHTEGGCLLLIHEHMAV